MARAVTGAVTMSTAVTSGYTPYAFQPCRLEQFQTGGGGSGRVINATENEMAVTATQYFCDNDMVTIVQKTGTISQLLTADALGLAGFCFSGGSATGAAVVTGYPKIMCVNDHDVYRMSVWSATASITRLSALKLRIGTIYNLCQVTFTYADGTISYGTAVDLDTDQTACRVKIVGVPGDANITSLTEFCPVLVRFLPLCLNEPATVIGPGTLL